VTCRSSSGGCYPRVWSGSRLRPAAAWCVPAGATWLRWGPLPFSPPLRWKVFLTSSLPTARHASSSFTLGAQEGKIKIPPSLRSHQLFQQRKRLHHVWAAPQPARGVSVHPAASQQPTQGRAAARGCSQNRQLPGVTSPAHICSGTALSAVASLAQKLLPAKWLQPRILAYL